MSAPLLLRRSYVADPWLMGVSIALAVIGVIMLASASLGIAQQTLQEPFYYVMRQTIYALIGLACAICVVRVKIGVWERLANPALVACIVLLIAVLIPGIGREVNGSYRWIGLGFFNLQVSELVKLFLIVYFAAFLTKKLAIVNSSLGQLLLSLLPLVLVAILLALEPDLGATAVIGGAIIGMYFLAGIHVRYFLLLLGAAVSALVAMIVFVPWRLERLMTYAHACEPGFDLNQGYQLCQALIAFGRGEWFGVGLGSGVQKEFYLPEAHTDFLLAVLGEELGAVGTLVIIGLFIVLFYRAFCIARMAEKRQQTFAALLAYGIAFWLGLQSIVNIGVNMGVLPTKGITLPLVSYGGSSVVVTCVAIAILLRIAYETKSGKSPATADKGAVWPSRAS